MISFDTRTTPLYENQFPTGELEVFSAGRRSSKAKESKRMLQHYILLYAESGKADFEYGKKAFTLSAGSLVVLSPYFELAEKGGGLVWWVEFSTDSPELVASFLSPVSLNDDVALRPIVESLCNVSMLSRRRKAQEALLLSLFLVAEINPEAFRPKIRVMDRVNRAIAEHLTEKLTAAVLANMVHYQKDYLCRLVRKETGHSLKEYINLVRLERAKSLLKTTSFPISAVAKSVGFEDSNLFSKFFRYHVSLTPGEYRRGT